MSLLLLLPDALKKIHGTSLAFACNITIAATVLTTFPFLYLLLQDQRFILFLLQLLLYRRSIQFCLDQLLLKSIDFPPQTGNRFLSLRQCLLLFLSDPTNLVLQCPHSVLVFVNSCLTLHLQETQFHLLQLDVRL